MNSALTSVPVLFSESQSFLRPWWWLALLMASLPAALYLLTWKGSSTLAPLPAKAALLLPGLLVVGLFTWLRLDVCIDAQGITYRMRPLGWTRLSWAQIRTAQVRQYSPLREYGGWGIRGTGRNRALNIAGHQGLQLELADGRRLLLGTQRPTELRQVLARLGALTAR